MILRFRNKCKYSVEINILDGTKTEIAPHKSIEIENEGGTMQISITLNKNNCIKNDLFHIVIVSNYVLSDISDFDEFVITREKIRFSYNAFYERLYLTSTGCAKCVSETNLAKNSSDVEKMFNKNYTMKTLLAAPFYHPKLTLASTFVGCALTVVFSWKFALVYFPAVYFMTVLLTWLGKSVVEDCYKNRFGLDEKSDLNRYVDPNYISAYYNNPDRKPFLGRIDRE